MRLKDNLMDIYKMFIADETLLRLLYYKPSNLNDNPLDSSKEDILEKDTITKWDIIQDRIKTTEKVDDLDEKQICRICIHAGTRNKTINNKISKQAIIIDVNTHISFDEVDFRLMWICDRVEELMFDERITGLGKMSAAEGVKWAAPNGYVAYRLIYYFGSVN